MKSYMFTALWGIGVWLVATLFFRFFGGYVLYSPHSEKYLLSIACLLVITAFLLLVVTVLYRKFDNNLNAALRFGVIGSIIGLGLDTFSLAYHHLVFPDLDESQIIAFATWMSCAYALYLIIPAVINRSLRE